MPIYFPLFLSLLALSACATPEAQFHRQIADITAQCAKLYPFAKGTTEANTICEDRADRPLVQKFYPDHLETYDDFYARFTRICSDYDTNQISDAQFAHRRDALIEATQKTIATPSQPAPSARAAAPAADNAGILDLLIQGLIAVGCSKSHQPSTCTLNAEAAYLKGHSPNCCKVCSLGKACGDTCITRADVCHVGPGCACDQ